MNRLLPLLLIAAGCSEYDLRPDNDVGGFDSDLRPTDEDVCDPDVDPLEIPVNEECFIEPVIGTFTPVVEWNNPAPGDSYTTPVIGNLTDDNGDGVIDDSDTPDVVVASGSRGIYVFDGATAQLHWSYNTGAIEPATPAIGDLDGDGRPEVVAAGNSGVFAFRGTDGSILWNGSLGGLASLATCGGVGIYDLDADGLAEVVIGSVILNGQNGSIRGQGGQGHGTGYSYSNTVAAFGVAADIDVDGDLEVVVGNALYDANGVTIWQNGQSDGFVAVGDFDPDPKGEIVVAWSGNLRLQDDDGSVLWVRNGLTGATIGPPTVADFDGDGEPEIGVAGNGVYTVVDTDGTTLWSRNTQDASSGFTGSSVFDFEGDGRAEVVYADEVHVWVFDGANGETKLQGAAHSSATCSEYPAVADVDNDGHAEIVYTSSPFGGKNYQGVSAIGDFDDSWQPGRTVWNQHGYSITNIDEDGGVPVDPDVNWSSYNSFRSGDLTAATGGAYADATPEVEICEIECVAGLAQVTVRVANPGVTDLPAGVSFSIEAVEGPHRIPLASGQTVAPVPSGETSEGQVFALSLDDLPFDAIEVSVDGEGGLGECDEENNSVEIAGICDGYE